MSDAMRSFAFRRHTRHEHKTVAYASFMCLVVTAIAAAEFQRRIRQARLKPTRSGSHAATTRNDYNLPRGNWSAAAHNRRALVCYQ